MFDKLKQLKQMKELNDSLAKEEVIIEKNGIKVVIGGKMEVKEIILNSELSKEDQERMVKECLNEAFASLQMKIAQKMTGMTGLGL
ncbi:MAG: YbaB/EbfC family nucleoid-associated protein [bacterium]